MNNITLSPSQKGVIDHFPHFLASKDQFMTVVGYAGTGKTFVISYLAQINAKIQKFAQLMDDDIKPRTLRFTATTNKAAAVLEEMLGIEACTIHSLLRLKVKNNYKTGKQQLVKDSYGKVISLRNTIVFIDEASMISGELIAEIKRAARDFPTAKFVFIGDEYQLPPVNEPVCGVFTMPRNVVKLKEIQRQAAENPIIQLSMEYRACLEDHEKPWPTIVPDDKHIFTYSLQEKAKYFAAIKQAVNDSTGYSDYRVLAWSNNRVNEYNQWIRKFKGYPDNLIEDEVVITNKPFVVGERIVAPTDSLLRITRIEPAEENGIEGYYVRVRLLHSNPSWDTEPPGMAFMPKSWSEANTLMKQYAADAKETHNWEPYFYIKNAWADLRPIYASTVHKSQGSTYGEVFVDLTNISKNTKWKEVARLVYVAITRTNNKVHLLGELSDRYTKKPTIDLMEEFRNVNVLSQL